MHVTQIVYAVYILCKLYCVHATRRLYMFKNLYIYMFSRIYISIYVQESIYLYMFKNLISIYVQESIYTIYTLWEREGGGGDGGGGGEEGADTQQSDRHHTAPCRSQRRIRLDTITMRTRYNTYSYSNYTYYIYSNQARPPPYCPVPLFSQRHIHLDTQLQCQPVNLRIITQIIHTIYVST